MQQQNQQQQNTIRINHQIKAKDIRIISDTGENLGVKTLSEALRMAKETGLDLIEINPKINPPVCKLQELGKWKFDEKKRQSEIKRNTFVSEVKEVGLRPSTDKHDLEHKMRLAQGFLDDGHKVKFVAKMRGREQAHSSLAFEKLQEILAILGSNVSVISEPKAEPKTVTMMVEKKK